VQSDERDIVREREREKRGNLVKEGIDWLVDLGHLRESVCGGVGGRRWKRAGGAGFSCTGGMSTSKIV